MLHRWELFLKMPINVSRGCCSCFATFGLFAYRCYALLTIGVVGLGCLQGYLFLLYFGFTDCPGTEAEEAGKASACDGCPNQQICATAPKGSDPGTYLFHFIQY